MIRIRSLVLCVAALGAACTPGTRDPAAGAETSATPNATTLGEPREFGRVRIALAAHRDQTAPLYVQLSEEGSQPAWVTLWRGTERVWLQERCELPDCGQEPAVCGAALPMVRNIGALATQRSVELVWDGRTSLQTTERCEIRQRVTSAEPLRARFCWSPRAQLEGAGNPAMGRVVEPVCADRALAASDTVMVFVVPR